METLGMPGFGVKDASRRLLVSRTTLYDWIKQGKVNARKDAVGKYEIPYEELWRLLKERENRC